MSARLLTTLPAARADEMLRHYGSAHALRLAQARMRAARTSEFWRKVVNILEAVDRPSDGRCVG